MIDFFQYGYDYFLKNKGDSWPGWHCMPDGYPFIEDYSNHEYYSKCKNGFQKARREYLKPYWKPIWEKLKALEEENNIRICTGCGCCGAGYHLTVDGFQYEVSEEDLND